MSSRHKPSVSARALAAVKAASSDIRKLRREAKAAKAGARQLKEEFKAARKHSKQARRTLRAAEQELQAARRAYRATLASTSARKTRARAAKPSTLAGATPVQSRRRPASRRKASTRLVPIAAPEIAAEHSLPANDELTIIEQTPAP